MNEILTNPSNMLINFLNLIIFQKMLSNQQIILSIKSVRIYSLL